MQRAASWRSAWGIASRASTGRWGSSQTVSGPRSSASTRADLHAILAEGLGAGSIRFGASCTGYEQDGDAVSVSLEGRPDERADVLIGADGINSTIRRQLLNDGLPIYTGVMEWHAAVSPPEGVVPPRTYRERWGPGARFGFYPINGGTCWYTIVRAPEASTDPPGGRKAAVLERFKGWPEPTATLVEATPEERIVRLDLVARRPGNRWVDQRVALVGDAAHAMPPNMGQGSAQAIEDAVVIARSLCAAANVPEALVAYQERRAGRVKQIADLAWRIGQLGAIDSRAKIALRNQFIRLISPRIGWKKQEGMLAYDF